MPLHDLLMAAAGQGSLADIAVVEAGGSLGGTAITFSSAVKTGDVVFMFVTRMGSTATVPSGYVLGDSGTVTTNNSTTWAWYYKVFTGTPDTGINWNDTNADGSGFTYYVLRNVDNSNPVMTYASAANTQDPPAVTVTDKCMVIAAAYGANTASGTFDTCPTNYTGFITVDATAFTDADVGTAFRLISGPTTEDPSTFSGTSFVSYYAATVAVRPAKAGTKSIFFVGAAQNQLTTTGSLTIDVACPSGVQAGDLLISMMTLAGGNDTWTPPSGWTEVIDVGGSNQSFEVCYKVAGSSEPSSYTFTSTLSGQLKCGVIVAFRNAAYNSSAVNSASNTMPSVTLPVDGAVIEIARNKATNASYTPANGLVTVAQDTDATGASYVVVYQYALAGSVSKSITFSSIDATSCAIAVTPA